MKKILALAFFLFVLAGANTFAQTADTRVFETSNDFAEIKGAFQRRLYDASSEYKYFFHQLEGFVVNLEIEDQLEVEDQLFDKKARKAISRNKYFIFEEARKGLYFLVLVNKENSEAISFLFSSNVPSLFQAAEPCSRDEIDKALAWYPDL